MVASTAVVSASVSESLDFESVVFVESGVVVGDDWLVPLLVVPPGFAVVPESVLLGSVGELAFAALPESWFDGGGSSTLLFALLFCGGGAGRCGGAESLGVFWLTRLPKRSLADGVLARVSHEGAAWNAALAAVAASGGALTTGRPPTKELTKQ